LRLRHNLRDNPMTFSIPFVMAQAAPAVAPAGNPILAFLPFIALFGVIYFLMIRPQMKRQKELRTMLSALSKGDEVVTNGGIAGRIDEVGETFLSVEIAANVVVKVQKGSVSQVLPKGSLKSV
jgi:preprotein translocase subunit YajC